ncbi:MAG: oxygenase [Cytophagaceae bacterium]|nr:oxygenase [Gemmatimonadaceae bacterium]
MRSLIRLSPLIAILLGGCGTVLDLLPDIASCGTELDVRPFAPARTERFTGNVQPATARCRGGHSAQDMSGTPWVDWTHYWGTGDASSRSWLATKNVRGVNGALVDLEYARVELIRFNLFDNNGTFPRYTEGEGGVEGPALRSWAQMRLPPTHPSYAAVGGVGAQVCSGELIRFRTVSGICNDIRNPLMGAAGTLFARNVEFESSFPEMGLDSLARNRHGTRLALLTPDPQVISRRLLTRIQSDSAACAEGQGKPGFAKEANCDYHKAPFFNVLAAFWIQFMTHDWFSHMEEGRNAPTWMPVGCQTADAAKLGCRPGDAIDRALVADSTAPPTFQQGGMTRMARAPRTFRNTNSAWWDASQIYGFDDTSRRRVKRDPKDPAKLLLAAPAQARVTGDAQGYLPTLAVGDPMLADWAGQESAGFADNWSIGMSFYHTVFSREHNAFVDEFRRLQTATPTEDSGLRNPARPTAVIRYQDVSADELFELARLVVAAEIAKIHTIEWTTQLLYDEPLFKGMNANWGGLVGADNAVGKALATVVGTLGRSDQASRANSWYSVLAAGAGIVGTGSHKASYSIGNPDDVNGGVNHFGSPFNFPEEFVSVYRLHPLVPDLLEYRQLNAPDAIAEKVPVAATFRGRATPLMQDRGLSNWALTMGRQRLGLLTLQNSPLFLQNLHIDRLNSPTKTLDVVALDLIRDRERGVPRFNEFRRQYGLRGLTSYDDFIDRRLPAGSPERARQESIVKIMREVYGQHACDASRVISTALANADGTPINDCLGHPNGSMVDNIEDVDNIIGYLAEFVRPHGYAISETQFMVFVLNASRRLFSDRFLTSSFRAEFYSTLGLNWVNQNGPQAMVEPIPNNGHDNQPVAPLKRILLRVMPELGPELRDVVNTFDPWTRDRGEYYSLQWKPRAGAAGDEGFKK